MSYNSDKKIDDELPVISKIGFCKYKGQLTERPLDVAANRAVQFWFNYQWTPPSSETDSTKWECKISNINWRARSNISGTPEWCGLGRSIEEPNGSVLQNHDEYCKPNHLTITFNTTTFAPADTSLYISSPSGYHFKPDEDFIVNTDQKFIIANFKYSYKTNPGTENEVEYLVEIPNIKISRPTKYDKNLVFTEAGLNELIDNIKRYPVVDIIGDAPSSGERYITINYGDSNKGTNGSKQVKVGSNISFPNETTPLPASQTDGTIRITIDNTTHEIPVYGLSGSGGSFGITADYANYDSEESSKTPKTYIKDKYVNKITTDGQQMKANLTIGVVTDTSQKELTLLKKNGNQIAQFKLINETSSSNGAYCYVARIAENDPSAHYLFQAKQNASDNTKTDLISYFNVFQIDGVNITAPLLNVTTGNATAGKFWRGDKSWANCLSTTSAGSEPILNFYNGQCIKGNTPSSTVYGGIIYLGANSSDGVGARANALGRIATYIDGDSAGKKTITDIIAIENTSNSQTGTTLSLIYDKNGSGTTSFNSYARRIDAHSAAFMADKVFNAVFNDYAEYRTTINLTPGHVVIDQDDGSLTCSYARLQPGAQVISDTFGHSMGETEDAKTPLAVAGRVLVYTYQPRENYHAGMAVCSAPDGTVDIMTREEIRDYPDCIVGIVSEIPQYETWGSDNVKVNGRIWIKVK